MKYFDYFVKICEEGKIKKVKKCLKSNKYLNISDKNNKALFRATKNNRLDVVKLLLSNNLEYNYGVIMSIGVAELNNNEKIKTLLIEFKEYMEYMDFLSNVMLYTLSAVLISLSSIYFTSEYFKSRQLC